MSIDASLFSALFMLVVQVSIFSFLYGKHKQITDHMDRKLEEQGLRIKDEVHRIHEVMDDSERGLVLRLEAIRGYVDDKFVTNKELELHIKNIEQVVKGMCDKISSLEGLLREYVQRKI